MRIATAGKAATPQFVLGCVVPCAVVAATALFLCLTIGTPNALLILGTAAWPAFLIWALCWLAADTRGKVGFAWVLMTSMTAAGVATTAWQSYYRIDLAKVDLSVHRKLLPPPQNRVVECVVLSSMAGAIIGAVASRIAFGVRNRVNVTPNTGQPQSPPPAGHATRDG